MQAVEDLTLKAYKHRPMPKLVRNGIISAMTICASAENNSVKHGYGIAELYNQTFYTRPVLLVLLSGRKVPAEMMRSMIFIRHGSFVTLKHFTIVSFILFVEHIVNCPSPLTSFIFEFLN